MTATHWRAAKALNVRPMPEDLRQALRELARAEGLQLYAYIIGVLSKHVEACQPDPHAGAAPADTSA